MEWSEFVVAGAVFLAAHRIPTIPSVRSWLVALIGERGFLIGFSVLSVALLWWLILAAGRAPYVELWPQQRWQAWVPTLSMLVVCALIAFLANVPNPLSFGGSGDEHFDPNRPGVVGVARHGFLWALFLWSVAHIVPNGNLAHVILFATFALFSLQGMWLVDKRKQRALGMDRWRELAHATSFWPFGAMIAGRGKPEYPDGVGAIAMRIIGAIVIYAALVWSHGFVTGVDPWANISS